MALAKQGATQTVLSFSLDGKRLREREAAFGKAGFEVHSANTETQARFEIEMGRCGIFLICSRTAPLQAKELGNLFRRYCPDGRIIFVMNELIDRTAADADLFVPESGGPDAIVRALIADLQSRAA